MKIVLMSVMALSLCACASYTPQPLEEHPASLDAPTADMLGQSVVSRPYLRPESIDLNAPLDGNAVAALAVLANRDLEAMRVRAGLAEAQVFAAGLLPDPTFDVGIDHILSGPDPVDNLAGALGLDINALRTRTTRKQQAAAGAEQVRMDIAWAEWQTAGEARIQATRLAVLTEIEDLSMRSRDASRLMLQRSLQAAGRADIGGDSLQTARLSVADAEAQAQQAEQELATARLELNRLLGLPPDYVLQVAEAPMLAAVPDAGQLLQLALSMRVDLAALRAGYAAQEASVHQAVLDQFPSLNLTINGARDTGRNVLLGPAVNFTLPLWNRNRGGIAVARATRQALKSEYDARLFQTRADIAAAVAGIDIARRQFTDQQAQLPGLQHFASASRAAAQRGDMSDAAAVAAEQALRDRRILYLQSRLALAEQGIALELLTGAVREQWK